MRSTDGLVVRCPECGSFNIVLDYDPGDLRKCRFCEGTINVSSSVVKKIHNAWKPKEYP
jgi:hypothetical protein